MPTTTLAGRTIEVNEEGFLLDPNAWDDDLAAIFAAAIGIELTPEHRQVLEFVRSDYFARGETPTLRRVQNAGGYDVKRLFELFPAKPAKKMSYIAGVPKPKGCV